MILALAVGLFATRANLARVRAAVAVEVAQRDKALSDAVAANAIKTRDAIASYAARADALTPIVVRSTEKVERHALTPAGRAACLDADRVRDIAADRAALFPDPSGSAGALPAGTAAAGVDEQR